MKSVRMIVIVCVMVLGSALPAAAWWVMHTPDASVDLHSVWGVSAQEVYAVGEAGTIWLYDGDGNNDGQPDDRWESVGGGAPRVDLHAVWGFSHGAVGRDLFAAGDNGTILYSADGTTWVPMTTPTTKPLYGLWGSSPADMFAVGYLGTALHYDGNPDGVWRSVGVQVNRTLFGVWDGIAVGKILTILAYSESRDLWRTFWPGNCFAPHLNDICGDYIVGDRGKIVERFGTHWDAYYLGTYANNLRGVWDDGTTVVIVGEAAKGGVDGGLIVRKVGDGWGPNENNSGVPCSLQDVWGIDGCFFAVGDNGTVLTSCEPTLVRLRSFDALALGPVVLLRWETVAEIDNAGFVLSRAIARLPAVPLHDGYIPPADAAGPDSGAVYWFVDTGRIPGVPVSYRLSDVDTDGITTLRSQLSLGPLAVWASHR